MNLELISTSSITVLNPVTFIINKQVQIAEIGIIIELVIKSKKSRILKPSGLIKSNTPKPREQGIPKIRIPAKIIAQHFFLERLNWSWITDTQHSINEIADVKAANRTNKKNTIPIRCV